MLALPSITVVVSSSGGIPAFMEMVRHLPDSLPTAILWLHQHSELTMEEVAVGEVKWPVQWLTNNQTLHPGHIYLVPKGNTVQFSASCATLVPSNQQPADALMQSLAAIQGEQAIAIILSGTESDGIEGIQAITAQKGTVFVQTPRTAQQAALPKQALCTACADFVLPPADIAYQLAKVLLQATKKSTLNSEWQTLLEHTPDIIVRYDKTLHVQSVNTATTENFGIAPEKFTGLHPLEFKINSTDPQALINKIKEVFHTGKKQEHISELQLPAGKRFYHSVIIPEFDKNYTVESVLVIGRNITQFKKVEEELLASKAQVQEKNEQLTRVNEHLENFVYTIAHDLRSPVANLKMLTGLLAKQKTDEKGKLYLDSISHSVDRLENTITGLVEVLEVQSTYKITVHHNRFQQILEEVTTDLKEEITRIACSIASDFTDCPEINYIRPYLVSIFKNMISNSLKYRNENRPLLISISSSRGKGFIILQFKDNGTGIDLEKMRHKLFKPFMRLTTKAEGKGIGLHLVKNMVERNGGRIEVESGVNDGTIFTCYLKEYAQTATNV